ncbi:MAG: TonB-dependent receptor [Bacteroidales bacterium]|nr:TonB-dependent receptor [Bacteroidales bacterium]MBN2750970.1 TonB-dependent receptor [Bacteroidales bacterium]
MRRLISLLPLLLCASFSWAQPDTVLLRGNVDLPEVVVTGTGTTHYLKNAPVQTEVISGKALRNLSGRSVEEILGSLSASFSFSQNDMGSGMQLNGLGGGYILILLDGKRINGDVGGQNDLNAIDIGSVERIEIVKGASSSLYGSDAIAGVVNFITRKNRDRVSFSNTTRVGYHADVLQSSSLGLSFDRVSASTSVSYKHTDGWQNTSDEWYRHNLYDNSVTRTVNRSQNYKVAQSVEYALSKRIRVRADASYYNRWTYRPSGFPQWQLKDFYYRDQNYSMDATYRFSAENRLLVDASFGEYAYYYDYTQREYTDLFNANGERIVFYPGDRVMQSSQRRFMTRAKGVFSIGQKHVVSAGMEYSMGVLVSPMRLVGGDRASAYTLSAYAQDEWSVLPRLNVTSGIRLVHHEAFGHIATPKVSAVYRLGRFNLRATYSHGFKAPTVKELYYCYLATIMTRMKAYYGNENLRPQLSNYYSIGTEFHSSVLKLSLTLYYNGVQNMIALQPVLTSPEDKLLEVEETMRYTNLARARSYGADFTFALTLKGGFSVGGGYSFADAKAQDPEQGYFKEYKPINGTSYHNATARMTWDKELSAGVYRLSVSLFGRYQSERFYITDGNTNPYSIWRLNTSHSFLKFLQYNVDMSMGVDNIFNYVDRTPFGRNRGTSTPGRTLYVSLNLQFKDKKSTRSPRMRGMTEVESDDADLN